MIKYLHPKISIYSVIFSIIHSYYSSLYFLSLLQIMILLSGIVYHNKIMFNYSKYRYIDIMIVLFGLYHHIDHYNSECKEIELLFIIF